MVYLSLFDGHSCLQQAIERSEMNVTTYYASEIDKHAIKVTQYNYPNTIQLGSVVNIDVTKLGKIDFIGGGSPCQSFSFAGKRKGMATKCETEILTLEHYLELKNQDFEFEGQSYLFWEYMRILTDARKINPHVYFLLENVEMGEKWEKVLSKAIGVNGIHINSALVSAQNRKRIYWTNIGMQPGGLFGDLVSTIQQPKDKGILLKDILEDEVDEKYFLSEKMISCLSNRKKTENYTPCKFEPFQKPFEEKSRTINQRIAKMGDADNYLKIDKKGNISPNQDKASCFMAGGNSGGNHSDMDLIFTYNQDKPNSVDGKKDCLRANAGGVLRGVGIINNSRIRRLTPTECCRLQTVKDNYFKDAEGNNIISETQQYKCLGNGWTIDVIVHLLYYLPNEFFK